jgi:hypothetical protein
MAMLTLPMGIARIMKQQALIGLAAFEIPTARPTRHYRCRGTATNAGQPRVDAVANAGDR